MKRPKLKDYKKISGIGAFDYVSDVNKYMDYLEAKLNNIGLAGVINMFCLQGKKRDDDCQLRTPQYGCIGCKSFIKESES